MPNGLVMRSTGSWYDVRSESGEIIKCRLRGKFKIKGLKVSNPLAVGDWVVYEMEDAGEGTGVITKIHDRENYIIRQSVHKTGHGHIIAANLDQAILIATLAYPKTSLGFIDRFLVSAESFRIPTKIIFNKVDLLDEAMLEEYAYLKAVYEPLGYECFLTSATEGQGMEEFKNLLHNQKSLLSGHSGVGKSTLVNAIAPELDIRTSEISDFSHKGVHTTTFAEMHEIFPDSFIIDTPGIRELGLLNIKPQELGHYFPEMRALLNECKFNDCIHVNEPQCAVMAAVEEGMIAPDRYESYLSMLANNDNRR